MNLKYMNKIADLMKIVETQEIENMSEASNMLVQCIQDKKSIYCFGAGHAGILAQEVYYRAGGLALINPIFASELLTNVEPITFTSTMERLEGYGAALAETKNFQKGDVLILHSVSGRNAVVLEMALVAKKAGAYVIAITNLASSKSVSSRHSSKKKLYEIADVIIDNHGDIGDSSIKIDGLEQKVSPTSTVIGATILNTIIVDVVEKLIKSGMENPPVLYSANMDGGDEKNAAIFDKYKDCIHYRA